MKKKAILMFLVICVLVGSVMVYGQTAEKVDMYGKITKIVFDGQGKIKEVSVDNVNDNNEPYDKVIAIITGKTKILKDNVEISELVEGQIVSIVFKEGPITMIYPARIEAELIKVVEDVTKPEVKEPVAKEKENQEKAIMVKFAALIKKGTEVNKVLEFIDRNISSLSKENASVMINKFESLQKASLSKVEEKFFDGEIQSKMSKIYQPGVDLTNIQLVKDQQLKNLLLDTQDSGYKMETAEGMYFPIINYEMYKKYVSYVSPDVQEYIEIMAVESNKVPAKDAALVIGWEEIVKRALSQEKFINQYPESVKLNDVKELYRKYVSFVLFGTNNTPLFKYDSKVIVEEAKNVYTEVAQGNENSQFGVILQGYLDVLKESNYKLNDKVQLYRKNLSENVLAAYDYEYFTQEELISAVQNDIEILKTESDVQKIEESNYGEATETTGIVKVTDTEVKFEAAPVVFSGNYKGHFTPGKSYPYYADAAMGGQRGISVKDNFGVWHSFGYRVSISQ